MTEEQAKTKWCPQTNGQGAPEENLCIASECMWWVWEVRKNEQGEQLKWSHGRCGAIK